MEAGAVRVPRGSAAKAPSPGSRLAKGLSEPLHNSVAEAGNMARFFGRALAEVPGSWRYASEILRQAGILVVGSAAVIWFMEFVMGAECATEANYVLRGYGATIYSGVFTSWCANREMGPYMWGYIVSAKIGCGLVAEIGSMRINEELDAMEAQGLNPMRYVVATRLVAAWLTFPLIYLVGLTLHELANYIIIVHQIGEVSQGGWELIHWAFQDPMDLLYGQAKIMAMGTAIVLVAMYYGYHARGGPVGVGTATARSMILNLVLVHIIGSLGTMIFWGLNPRGPIGG
ncbi:ABC transporter permease [Conexibacter sp. SYSU D00693]|uniref:ABC transporter permease n=1 Tax=Conexibacter sp. SYSU D00693 TaxID=2812560 RepID=UPI001F12140B|nr:ABC transporter permease [Conexibacter sp. SYSU D00693]